MNASTDMALVPNPLPRSTVRETTLEALRDMIVDGQLKVGQALRQDELAAQLGISRTPLREALQILATEGLVQLDSHRSAVVAKPSAQQFIDTYEIREALETMAGRSAAILSTQDHADRVARVLALMTSAATPGEWVGLNAAFHREIYSIVPNAQLLALIDMMRNRADLYVRILAREEERVRHADDSHEQMLAALRRRDPDAMEALVRAHLRSTINTVRPLLDADLVFPAEST